MFKKMAKKTVSTARDLLEKSKVAGGFYNECEFVICGEEINIALAQVHPILDNLAEKAGWVTRANSISAGLWRKSKPKIAFIQSYWDTPIGELNELIGLIRNESPGTRICYLDWFAPVNFPFPEIVDVVDLYVKKNILKDRSLFRDGLRDTNLVEYESRWNSSFLTPPVGAMTPDRLNKVMTGWGFGTDRKLVRLLEERNQPDSSRPIDLHCRIAAPSEDSWYGHMRRRSLVAAEGLKDKNSGSSVILTEVKRLGYADYISELKQSKACLSPFGYGEVCWRDYEAIGAGCVLIKPDMSHLECSPDMFEAGETYLSVAWDFSDLEQAYELACDEAVAVKTVLNAQERWREYLQSGWSKSWEGLLHRLGVEG